MPPARPDDDDYDDRDERPAKKRRRFDDDEDDDRPRRSRKSSNTAMTTTMILLIVGGIFGVFLLICGGILVAIMLPAVSKVREASTRMKDTNNMKQMAIAMHNLNDATGAGLVAPYAVDGRRTPMTGHSFRVSLLPYLEHDSVYRAIDMTQPWDSARNAPQTNLVIPQYQSVDAAKTPNNQTPYRAFVGNGALFDTDGKPVRFAAITDGTANTIMVIEAAETVPWAKPQELPYSKTGPLPKFGSKSRPDGFLAMMADGSVRFIKHSVSEQMLRSAIERADGKPVNLD